MAIVYFQNKYYPLAKRSLDSSQVCTFPHQQCVAFENNDTFFASGLNEGGNIHFERMSSSPSTTLKEWIGKSFGDTESIESEYAPGTYYKRIWRPLVCGGNLPKVNSQEKMNQSFIALKLLLNKLEKLFETIEPTNLSAYGHRIREIILLASMEVESSWSAVLKENEYTRNDRFTTNDYVKLLGPMFLDGYKLHLQSYPDFPAFMPFMNWDRDHPTESLKWYDAYNKTKHDHEDNIRLATLENAVHAVGAAVVMFHAQFGLGFGTGVFD